MQKSNRKRIAAWAAAAVLAGAGTAIAVDFSGTVSFTGNVVFDAPIAGITLDDITVSVGPETEATGNGEKCSILSSTADSADALGAYPDAGAVSADMLLERGGPQIPDGLCIVSLVATGSNGVDTSARGTQTVFVPAADIDAASTLAVADITVRPSKAIAGLDKDCLKWTKKQAKLRAKCNDLLLKKGPAFADKCKDADIEPPDCDDGNRVEAQLVLAYGANDQQTDPMSAEGVDKDVLKDQLKCQKFLGKAVTGYTSKYVKRVVKKCVDKGLDGLACRQEQAAASKKKIDKVDKCVVDQLVDGGTGRTVPVVGAPCDTCISGAVIDRKCMKSCYQLELTELGDGLVGDIPECGNGILQQGEFCDDGNLVNGDCCSDACTVEAGTPEGPMGDPTCIDVVDNDCDTLVDAADPDCQ